MSVDVEDFIVGFHEGLIRSTWKVEGYVKEIYGFLICFDSDFEAIGLKNFTNFLLRLFNFLSQTIVTVETNLAFKFRCNEGQHVVPTSSHVSAPSYDPIVTSNKLLGFFFSHGVI